MAAPDAAPGRPPPIPSRDRTTRETVRRVLALVAPYKGRLVFIFLLILLGTGSGLASPLFLKAVVDVAIPERNVELLGIIVAAAFGLEVLRFGLGVLQELRYTGVTARILFDARRAMLEHLHALSPRFFSRARMGDLLSRINGDIAEMQSVASGVVLGLAQSVLMLVVASGIQLWLSPRLFLLSLAVFPPALWLTRRLAPRVQAAAKTLRETNAAVADQLVESLGAHKPIAADGLERTSARRFVGRSKSMIAAVIRLQLTQAVVGGAPGLIVGAGASAVLFAGGIMVIRDELALGSLIAFAAYQTRVYGPLSGFVGLPARLARARASVDRVLDVLDLRPEVTAPAEPRALPPAAPERAIELEQVGFAYAEGGPRVLDAVSFSIPAGGRVGVVGPSGSGKTTLLDLLLRLHDPSAGRIAVDGIDLRELDPRAWRRRTSLVLQEPLLFADTVAFNIACGRRGAEREEIEAAARSAQAHEFIAALPEGYDTILGDRGAGLSLGQRQRIAVARALLREPRLLVLDEATAHLDTIADQALREAIETLMEGRTTVVATHRVHAVAGCSPIVVLDRGRVVGQGAHEELLATCELYARLVERDDGAGVPARG